MGSLEDSSRRLVESWRRGLRLEKESTGIGDKGGQGGACEGQGPGMGACLLLRMDWPGACRACSGLDVGLALPGLGTGNSAHRQHAILDDRLEALFVKKRPENEVRKTTPTGKAR